MSSEQINSNEDTGEDSDALEEELEQVATEESTNKRFDPEALALVVRSKKFSL